MKKYLSKFLVSTCVLLLPVTSYVILGPLEVYFGNTKDFAISYSDFFPIFLLIAGLIIVVGAAGLALLPKTFNNIALSVILGVGVASYIQNMFMNIKLSENNGAPMDWSALGNFPIINLAVWIVILAVVIAVALYLKEENRELMLKGVSAFLSVIQLVAVISLLLTGQPNNALGRDMKMHGDKQFMLGKKENIVVFVLDTFGNTKIDNLLQEHPDALNGFEDFTYYSNADCHYYTTFPSVTHFLTGTEFDFESNSADWLENAWNTARANLFFQKLHEKEYSCNFYSDGSFEVTGSMQNLYQKFDNIQPTKTEVNTKRLLQLLGKISVYRYVPYVLKPHFEVLTHEFAGVVSYVDSVVPIFDNAEFFRQLTTQKLSIDSAMEKTFVIHHLFGIHAPYTTGSQAQFMEGATVNETVQGVLHFTKEYLNQMKALGIYDDATIIVMADHGAWWGNDPQPVFMLKQANESHDVMPVNAAPISLDDFQATILSLIGVDKTGFGTSIFEWNEGDIRERTVYMRADDESMPTVPGSNFNAYHGFTYSKDKYELIEKMYGTPEILKSATPW